MAKTVVFNLGRTLESPRRALKIQMSGSQPQRILIGWVYHMGIRFYFERSLGDSNIELS